jgi:xylan 1,4-beta-xylosidase
VLLWDFTVTNPGKSENNQTFYKRDLPAAPKGMAKIHLTHLAPGRYMQTVYQVGYRVNDAYAAYKDLASPDQLTRAQVEQLRAASDGQPVDQRVTTVGTDGIFDRELPMRENDVFLLVLAKQGQVTSKSRAR